MKDAIINKPAKNVIVFIGDGMGISTVTAARFLRAQDKKLTSWEDIPLSFEKMPHIALAKVCINTIW